MRGHDRRQRAILAAVVNEEDLPRNRTAVDPQRVKHGDDPAEEGRQRGFLILDRHQQRKLHLRWHIATHPPEHPAP